MKRREFMTSVAGLGMMALAGAGDSRAEQASAVVLKFVPPADRLIQVACAISNATTSIDFVILTTGSLALALWAASAGIQAGDAIETHRRALQANPSDAGTKMALKGLIDRPDPVPRDQDEQIREILRRYPWQGKTTLTLKDEPGQVLIVSGVVRDDQSRPIADAVLNVFQTDTNGHYTGAAVMDEPHARLFAYIRTGDDGRFEFTTIRPGAYPGRPERQGEQWRIPAHVHFQATAGGHQPSAFQMVFEDDSRMTPYWRAWAARGRHPIVPITRGRDGAQRAVCDITLRKGAANARTDARQITGGMRARRTRL